MSWLQVAQTKLSDWVQGLVNGTVSVQQFASATTAQAVRQQIESATLPGVLLDDEMDKPVLPANPPTKKKSTNVLAIALGAGIGGGVAVLGLAAVGWLVLRKRRSSAGSGSAAPGLEEPWVARSDSGSPAGAQVALHDQPVAGQSAHDRAEAEQPEHDRPAAEQPVQDRSKRGQAEQEQPGVVLNPADM